MLSFIFGAIFAGCLSNSGYWPKFFYQPIGDGYFMTNHNLLDADLLCCFFAVYVTFL